MFLFLTLLSSALATTTDATLGQLAERAASAITDGETQVARDFCEQGLDKVPSLDTPLTKRDLANLYLVMGAVEVYEAAPDQAQEHLAAACALDPKWFNDRLGSKVKTAWEQACTTLEGEASVAVAPIPNGSEAYLDGALVSGKTTSTTPGKHLVQVIGANHEPFNRLLTLSANQHAEIDPKLVDDDKKKVTPFLVGGGGAALAGLALGGVAFAMDRRISSDIDEGAYTYENRDDLLSDYARYHKLRTTSIVLGGVGVAGLGLHLAFR